MFWETTKTFLFLQGEKCWREKVLCWINNRCFPTFTYRFVTHKIRCHACLNRHTIMCDHKPGRLNKTPQNKTKSQECLINLLLWINLMHARSHQIQRLWKPSHGQPRCFKTDLTWNLFKPDFFLQKKASAGVPPRPGRWRYCTATLVSSRKSNQKKKSVNEMSDFKTPKLFTGYFSLLSTKFYGFSLFSSVSSVQVCFQTTGSWFVCEH